MSKQSGRLQGAGCAKSRGADRVQFATVHSIVHQNERLGDGVTISRQRRMEAGDINGFKSCFASRFTDAGAGLPTGSHFGFFQTGTPLDEAQIAKCADYQELASLVPSRHPDCISGCFLKQQRVVGKIDNPCISANRWRNINQRRLR